MHRGFPPFIEDQVWCVVEPLIKKYLDTHLKNSEDHVYLGTHTKMAVCIPSWCRGRGSEILPVFKRWNSPSFLDPRVAPRSGDSGGSPTLAAAGA